MQNTLLLMLFLPSLISPFIYISGRKNARIAAVLMVAACLIDLVLLYMVGQLLLSEPSHRYVESYQWVPLLHASITFFIDGISLPMEATTLILVLTATIFSIDYMHEKKELAEYYSLLALLLVGLLGVFMTSNLMLFYFFWELMLIPSYFIIGEWGYRDSYRAALKFFIFTHAGAVFILLGIGAIFMVTGDLDMFNAQRALMGASPDLVKWILLALTAGFAVKMAIVPLHMWLPDAHSEAPAPMSALLSGVIIGAGAYAILRITLMTVFPSVATTSFGRQFLHSLSVLAVISAFFGSLIALVENDIKRIIAYSSIAHMGYVLLGLSMFPYSEAVTGATLHLTNHALSKGLLFLSAGALMKQLGVRDIREMGGLAGRMPIISVAACAAALSIAGIPAFACFMSEFIMFVGAFKAISNDSFYVTPVILVLIATVLSLAYSLRYISSVFFGQTKIENAKDAPPLMAAAMLILAFLIVFLGLWPDLFLRLITTVNFSI